MSDIIKAIIFGIIQGITEWLPISSTGHMIIAEDYLSFSEVSPAFFDVFLVVIQFGSIMAVIVLFWRKLWPIRKKAQISEAAPPSASGLAAYLDRDILILWVKILIACLPAAVIGIFFDDFFESLFYNSLSVAIALIAFGIFFIIIETVNKNKTPKINAIAEITFHTAALIGIFQLIAAIFPGTSRSGATILGALLLGVARSAAAEFTFLLAVPVMAGASLLRLLRFGQDFSGNETAILIIGMIVAFIVSLFVIRFLLSFIRKHDFKVFGYYRIALGIVVLTLGFI